MIALLIATQFVVQPLVATVGEPAAQLAVTPPSFVRVLPPTVGERTPNVFKQPAHCKDSTVKIVDRYGRPLTQKLGDLPPGALQLAVDRSVNGCRVITVVRGTVIPDQSDGAQPGRMIPLTKTPAVQPIAPSDPR
jgi:hypothetical protein